jgi:hypothetical protein
MLLFALSNVNRIHIERRIMSKKMMMLTLTTVSAAMFALPGVVSAAEIHFEGPTSFTGTGGASSLVTSGEPTITCESSDVSGTISAGGTTGNMSFDFTGCHATVFGFTAKCRTAGSPRDNTIAWSATSHVITTITMLGPLPKYLETPISAEIICAGISNTRLEGNGVIGKITSPACGASSKELNLSFSATGSTQNEVDYTGVNYDLKTKTSGGAQLTAGLNTSVTLTSAVVGKLNCT